MVLRKLVARQEPERPEGRPQQVMVRPNREARPKQVVQTMVRQKWEVLRKQGVQILVRQQLEALLKQGIQTSAHQRAGMLLKKQKRRDLAKTTERRKIAILRVANYFENILSIAPVLVPLDEELVIAQT